MIFTATLPAQAAGAADVSALAGVYAPTFYSGDTVTDIELVAPPGYPTVSGAETDNVTVAVRQLRNGAALMTFASFTVGEGITLAPTVPVSIPIIAQPTLLVGDVIEVQLHQNGAGQEIEAGLNVSVFVS